MSSFSVSRRSTTGDLHTAKRVIHIPDMQEEHGWYYRPAVARTQNELARDSNKTFGRSSNGRYAAENWLKTYFHNEIQPYLLLDPILAIDRPYQFREMDRVSSGAAVAFAEHDPVWGWSGRGYALTVLGGRRSPEGHAVKTMAYGHPGQKLTIEGFYPIGYDTGDSDYVHFGKDGRDQAVQHIGDLVTTIPNWRDLPTEEWVQDGNEAYFISREGKWCADGTVPKDIVVKNMAPLREMFSAMRFLGIDIQERFTWTGEARNIPTLSSLIVTFTAKELVSRDEHHNNFGHTIYITSDGAKIRCGYVEDEDRWIEHEKRQAQQTLMDLINAPTTETYTITPRKEAT